MTIVKQTVFITKAMNINLKGLVVNESNQAFADNMADRITPMTMPVPPWPYAASRCQCLFSQRPVQSILLSMSIYARAQTNLLPPNALI